MSMGNWLMGTGIFLVILGLLYKFELLNWFGNLPGDIRYEGEKTKIYFPIMTMLVVSFVLSLLFHFFKR